MGIRFGQSNTPAPQICFDLFMLDPVKSVPFQQLRQRLMLIGLRASLRQDAVKYLLQHPLQRGIGPAR